MGSENQINHMSWIMLIAAAVCWAPGSRHQAEIRWYGLILGSAGVEEEAGIRVPDLLGEETEN